MGRPRKKASEMTDKELARKVFSPEVRREVRAFLSELNAEAKRKAVKKGSKKRRRNQP